jgi:hypothetical protein
MIPSSLTHVAAVGAVALLLATAACSFLSDDVGGLTVVNAMDEPVVFFGVDRELSHRMDLRARIPLDALRPDEPPYLVAPGASQRLHGADVDGGFGPGQTLRLFLYAVRRDTAVATSHRDVAYDTLRRRGGRVDISAFFRH